MAIDNDLLLVIGSSGIGQGEIDLGEKLMSSFLSMVHDSGQIPARMIFLNSGIFLTTDGSPMLDLLKRFEAEGTTILSCGACLDYYGRKEKLRIGRPTNMKDTVAAMLSFKRVIRP